MGIATVLKAPEVSGSDWIDDVFYDRQHLDARRRRTGRRADGVAMCESLAARLQCRLRRRFELLLMLTTVRRPRDGVEPLLLDRFAVDDAAPKRAVFDAP